MVVVLPLPVVGVLPLVVVVVDWLDADAGGLRKSDAEVAHPVFVDLEDGDIDDDLGAGAVKVVQQLLCEKKLVRGSAHDDGVLAGDKVDLDAGVEEVADGDDELVGVILRSGVGEVEGLDGLLVEVGALGAGVLGDEDGVGGDGLVEGAGDGADDAEGVGPANVGQIDGNALGGVVGIEEDVEAGGFADGLVDDLDVLDHVDGGDGFVGERLELDGAGDGADGG